MRVFVVHVFIEHRIWHRFQQQIKFEYLNQVKPVMACSMRHGE